MGSGTCLGCGCACDDIEVVVQRDRITEARHACPLGVAWFGDGTVPSRTWVAGRDASMDDAIGAAARLLTTARRPLIYLAPELTCEAQREAIALADGLRAALDSVTSATALPSVLASQEQGRAGATLGEVRNRADVLVFWGVDPALRYPRYWSRYAPEPAGVHVPDGRKSRKVIAIDIGDSRGPADADARIAISPDEEVAALTALATSGRLPASAESYGGVAPTYENLAGMLATGRYVVFVADAEPGEGRDAGSAAALIALTQALNGSTRCALSTLCAGGNRSGADACMTSQTGYPTSVEFARGYPRYRPFDGTASARLSRDEADAVLVIGSAALVPPAVARQIARVTHGVIGPRATDSSLGAGATAIDTAVAGIHEKGTALRMDDVPLPVQKCLDGPPGAREVIRALRDRIHPA